MDHFKVIHSVKNESGSENFSFRKQFFDKLGNYLGAVV